MNCDTKVFSILQNLGVSPNYKGFFQMATALQLCMEEPSRLTLVTKQLYPDVARRYDTKWQSVERNMRTVTDVIWMDNRSRLETMTRYKLLCKPCTRQLLSILLNYMMPNRMAVYAQ